MVEELEERSGYSIMKDKRCFGNELGKTFYAEYHDHEWGIPVHEDRHLFEMLVLEGAQAGLSWEMILKKRAAYRRLFHRFDPARVAAMTDKELESVVNNPSIIRNRRKIFSARQNACVFLKIQEEFGSFNHYLWRFVNDKPIVNRWKRREDVPCRTSISDHLSKDLKKRGMTFVGSKIIYAYMQAVGVVNDHLVDCRCSQRKDSKEKD